VYKIKFLFTLLFIILVHTVSAGADSSNVSYIKEKVRGVYVDIIQINLNSPDIKITPAVPENFSSASGSYPLESFSGFIADYKPTAAINGTYFDTITHRPVGSLVIGGKIVYNGCIGVAVCIDKENQVTFHHTGGSMGDKLDWSYFEGVICSGPSLVTEGEIDLKPSHEGFKDPAVYMANRRSCIGITEYNKLLLVTVKNSVTLRKLAHIMQDLGCLYAVNLDGGSSSALYYRGSYITSCGRSISNVILVYEDKKNAPTIFSSDNK